MNWILNRIKSKHSLEYNLIEYILLFTFFPHRNRNLANFHSFFVKIRKLYGWKIANPHLHYNQQVHNEDERCQEGTRHFIGRQEISVQFIPLYIICGNDEYDNKWCNEHNYPEQNDTVVSPFPPVTDGPGPTRIKLLLEHNICDLKYDFMTKSSFSLLFIVFMHKHFWVFYWQNIFCQQTSFFQNISVFKRNTDLW